MVRKAAGMIISISMQMIICALVIILLYNAGVKGFEFGESVFSPTAVSAEPGRDMIVIIEEDASAMEVAKLLEDKGLINDYKVFFVQALLYKAEFQPAAYTLNTSMTSEDMIEVLTTVVKTEESES